METAIVVIWWIGLIVALVLTLVVLKLVALLLRVLGDIHRLAEHTREAARGIVAAADVEPGLVTLTERAQGLRDAVHSLAQAAAAIERRLRVPLAGG